MRTAGGLLITALLLYLTFQSLTTGGQSQATSSAASDGTTTTLRVAESPAASPGRLDDSVDGVSPENGQPKSHASSLLPTHDMDLMPPLPPLSPVHEFMETPFQLPFEPTTGERSRDSRDYPATGFPNLEQPVSSVIDLPTDQHRIARRPDGTIRSLPDVDAANSSRVKLEGTIEKFPAGN